ncbi:MAG: ACT domain-containing protein [Clostridia bacterium]|nr:ACT domain-containing protein [Clostridia bacterium]
MAIKQLTVFVPNRKGTIVAVTDILAKNGVNIRALSIAETEDFGILRLIVSDENAAEQVLKENEYLIKIVDVVGVKIGDEPGKLTSALDVLDKADINVEYLYAFMARTEKHAYVVLRVENNDDAETALKGAGFKLISEADIDKL